MTTATPPIRTLVVSVFHETEKPPSTNAAFEALTRRGFAPQHRPLKSEARYVEELLQTDSLELDAIVLVSSESLGARPSVVDLCDRLIANLGDKSLPGFGESLRRRLDARGAPGAWLVRATAGLVQSCFVFALPRRDDVQLLAVDELIAPSLAQALAELRQPA